MFQQSFYPAQYQPVDQLAQLRQNAPATGFAWVQGEEAARAYMVAPGHKMFLMDAENDMFYFKSTDPGGMPLPLRVFDFKERQVQPKTEEPPRSYVEREEFDTFKEELKKALTALAAKKEESHG